MGTTFLYLAINLSVDPCHSINYDILSGEEQRSSAYSLTVNDVAIEDSRLKPGWYRIDSVTGNDIVNYSVPMLQCGTVYPLWMQGIYRSCPTYC